MNAGDISYGGNQAENKEDPRLKNLFCSMKRLNDLLSYEK